ncbi:integrator complex subunit 15 isoform X2 [Bacillus rossius redtenbacheri]|uniref:integrator complex subunit 15 isoform X2 n=1 Tax=Bacillus rossius redtenbacheri TaxID=93214 RepID=UPI002FDD8C67
MSASASELKHTLRKADFPACAREALDRIEQLCIASDTGRNAKNMEIATDIMTEFVFCETDRRGSRRRELQLLEALSDYFKPSFSGGLSSDATRHAVFASLFPHGNADRLHVLVKLVSMAISTKNIPVLSATGMWMQQLGCTSKGSLDLAEGVVKDYFDLVPKAASVLQDLPRLAPQFTANFLTAVAEMYSVKDKKQVFAPPPEILMEVVHQWIDQNPTLCLAALLTNVAVTVVTPFAGLFKWCILSPLYYCNHPQSNDCRLLYSQLHLALIKSLMKCGQPIAANGKTVMLVQQFLPTVEALARWQRDNSGDRAAEAIELALDRLAQAVQIGLFTKCLIGNKEELLQCFDSLPKHQLLGIIMRKQSSSEC